MTSSTPSPRTFLTPNLPVSPSSVPPVVPGLEGRFSSFPKPELNSRRPSAPSDIRVFPISVYSQTLSETRRISRRISTLTGTESTLFVLYRSFTEDVPTPLQQGIRPSSGVGVRVQQRLLVEGVGVRVGDPGIGNIGPTALQSRETSFPSDD